MHELYPYCVLFSAVKSSIAQKFKIQFLSERGGEESREEGERKALEAGQESQEGCMSWLWLEDFVCVCPVSFLAERRGERGGKGKREERLY